MKLDRTELQKLFELLRTEGVSEFEHEADGVRMRVVRSSTTATVVQEVQAPRAVAAAPETPAVDKNIVEITSPFVGTFYRSPSPDAPSFVDTGATIRPGQTLCIIEAMKLMNEIESEISGTIVEVLVKNGKPVEYGQKLFRVKVA